ncbi:MAG: DUF5647 family protein [Trueperaceae bacterium]
MERNIWWSMWFTRMLIKHEDLRRDLPSEATIVLLPDDDEELQEHNLRLFRRRIPEGPVVFVNVGRNAERAVVHRLSAEPGTAYALA